MNKNSFIQIFFYTVIVFIIDYSILKFLQADTSSFIYPIYLLIGFFAITSLLIVLFLKRISKKNINNVGFIYLFLTSLKLFVAYIFLNPILNSTSFSASKEKINFFIIFILYLTIETVLTIRILNNKQ